MSLSSQRLDFIDFARTYAVLLAILAHALATTTVFETLGKDSFYIQIFTRTATPMFVFMFGFMIEFVYARKARVFGLRTVRGRLFTRGWQCYVAYVLTSLSAVIGGYKTFSEFLLSLVFFDDSRFGNILRVYAVILCFAPLIINFRIKYGLKFLVGALLVVMLSFVFLPELKTTDFHPFNRPLNIFFGIGPIIGGPSVWHSLLFVFAGMLTASSITDSKVAETATLHRFLKHSILLVLGLLASWFFVSNDGVIEALVKFANFYYRGINSPEYFIIGVIVSVITLNLFCFLIGNRQLPRPIRVLLPLGLASLTTYTAGNILLNLFGSFASSVNPYIFIIVFLVAVAAVVNFLEKLPFYEVVKDFLQLNRMTR